jgi:hypothetical protein
MYSPRLRSQTRRQGARAEQVLQLQLLEEPNLRHSQGTAGPSHSMPRLRHRQTAGRRPRMARCLDQLLDSYLAHLAYLRMLGH